MSEANSTGCQHSEALSLAGYARNATSGVWVPGANSPRPPFSYSDGGDVEQRLLDSVLSVGDRSVLSPELRQKISDWPSRYYFSPVRSNLLRPFEKLLDGKSVLEIGAGCGAISRYLGECGAQVLALEGSLKRAEVAAARCEGFPKVQVVADDLRYLPADPRFDVVTLIGVLEYARIFFPVDIDEDPVDAMLAVARTFLKPDGVLILAIENQLGLKYFSGFSEDHVSVKMFGIEDLYTTHGVVTFGREELADRLNRTGFSSQEWFYPFPDYKLPVSILTERGVTNQDGADLSPLVSASVIADPQSPKRFVFSLEQAWQPVMRNRLAGHLANSFLVLASPHSKRPCAIDRDVLAWHYSVERRPQFAKKLEILVRGQSLIATSRRINAGDTDDTPMALSQRLCDEEFFAGSHFHGQFVKLLNRPNWNIKTIADWTREWMSYVSVLDARFTPGVDPRCVLPGELIDAVPKNLLVKNSFGRFFDLEWVLRDGVEAGHLFYRGVVLSLLGMSSCAAPATATSVDIEHLFMAVAASCDMTFSRDDLMRFHQAERLLQFWVHGGEWIEFEELAAHCMPLRFSSGS